MTTVQSTSVPAADLQPVVREITDEDLRWALAEGWKDFMEKRGDVLVLAVIYPLIGFAAAWISFNRAVLPMFFPLVAGLSILGPAVASGFYEIARRREAGLPTTWLNFVDPLRGRGKAALAQLTGLLAILFVAWLIVAFAIYDLTLGASGPLAMADFFGRLFTTPQGWAMIALGNLAGFGFALATLVLTVVSFPMAVDKPVDAVTAIQTSIRAVRVNPGPIAGWGVRVASLLVLGCLPLFVGLAVVLPLLGYSTWHLYTRLVER